MLTKGLKRETIDEHIKFSGGQLVESRSKTALSIHAVSKVMNAIKANLLQNGGDKQSLGNLSLLKDDGKLARCGLRLTAGYAPQGPFCTCTSPG